MLITELPRLKKEIMSNASLLKVKLKKLGMIYKESEAIVVKPITPATSQAILLFAFIRTYKETISPIAKYAICNVGSLIRIIFRFPVITLLIIRKIINNIY